MAISATINCCQNRPKEMHTIACIGTSALKLRTKAREQIESKKKDVTRDSKKDYKFQVFELKVTMRLALVGRRCCSSRWCTCCSGRRCRRRCSATCSLLPAGFTRGLMEVSIHRLCNGPRQAIFQAIMPGLSM